MGPRLRRESPGLAAPPTAPSKGCIHAPGWADEPGAGRVRTPWWLVLAWMIAATLRHRRRERHANHCSGRTRNKR